MSHPSSISVSSNLYNYRPLENPTHIRIICIKSGDDDDPLQCTMKHVDINSGIPFSAVSYVWGNEEMSHRMMLGHGQHVPLTKSLYEALRNLRAVDGIGDKVFWVDQVCIDQNNADERSAQVALMGKIYRKATRVITYVGQDTPEDHEGIRLIQIFNKLWQQIEDSYRRLNSAEMRSFLKLNLPGEKDPAWDGYRSLTNRAWSTRLWMLQENVVNGNTIMVCGRTAFRWTVPGTEVLTATFDNFPEHMKFVLFSRRNRHLFDSGNSRLTPLPSVGQLLGLRSWLTDINSTSLPLLDVLRISRDFVCRDPRDKVYALLGLASDVETLQIEPDYTKSPAQVLTDTALRILRASSNLDVLNITSNAKEIKLPSWVPDWSPPSSRHLLNPMFLFVPGWDYCASAKTLPVFNFDAERSVLTIRGAIVDSIQCSAGDPSINTSLLAQEPDLVLEEYPRMREVLRRVCDDLRYGLRLDSIPDELIHSLSRTIVADRPFHYSLGDGEPGDFFLAYLKMYRFKFEMALFRRNGRSLPPKQLSIATQTRGSTFSEYSMIAEGRSLCVTKHSRFCLAPSETTVGDKVAILYGGKTAYILRPVGESFEFLGEAYVHGLMKGEALNDPSFESQVRKITLI